MIAAGLTTVLASPTTGSDGAGLIGFLIVAGLFVACWFLYKSLRRQLGRIDVSKGSSTSGSTDADLTGLNPAAPDVKRPDVGGPAA